MPDAHGKAHPVFGLLIAVMGGFVMAIGTELIVVDPSKIHAPMWVITMVGFVFWLAGLMVALPATWQMFCTWVLTPILLICFLSVFYWVGFFGEDIECTSSTFLFGFSSGERKASCRMFGYFAVLATVGFGAAFLHHLYRTLMQHR